MIGVRIIKPKIVSCLKLKKDDHALVSSEFWARIRPETFLKVRSVKPCRPTTQGLSCFCYANWGTVCYAELFLSFSTIH